MPGRGSTTKKCVVCHTLLNVACKICKTCKAEQPHKLRLRRKMEKFDKKRESWVHTHQKNGTTSHIRDEAHMLLEKLQALGVKAVLLLSRPGRKQHAWMSEVLAPRCQLTATSSTCLQKMKDLYDVVTQGWTPQGAAGQLDEPSAVPVEPPNGPQIAPLDPQVTMALLDSTSVGPQMAPTGPPAAPTEILAASTGPPACPVCLKKDGQTEIKTESETEAGHSPSPLSTAATTSPDIKPETEDITSTNNHTADHSSSPVLLVTVTHTGFDGDMKETGHCGEKEDKRKRREMSGSEASGQPFTSGYISDATSAASQRGIKEENIEAMCGGSPATSESVLVECKYENADATSGHEAAELQEMELETKVPQTSRASDLGQSSDMVEAPSSRPSTSCDLDTMDLDQLRREKIKMQIKVLRLQEEYYTQKMKEHKN